MNYCKTAVRYKKAKYLRLIEWNLEIKSWWNSSPYMLMYLAHEQSEDKRRA